MNAFPLQGCTIYFFVLQTVQSNSPAVLTQADSVPELGEYGRTQQADRDSRAPLPHHWEVNMALIADMGMNPLPEHSAVSITQSQGH